MPSGIGPFWLGKAEHGPGTALEHGMSHSAGSEGRLGYHACLPLYVVSLFFFPFYFVRYTEIKGNMLKE